MEVRTFCHNTYKGEPTFEELLAERAVRLLMECDGVTEAELRRLAREVRERTREAAVAQAVMT